MCQQPSSWFNWGMAIVDSLDTLLLPLLLELDEEYADTGGWSAHCGLTNPACF